MNGYITGLNTLSTQLQSSNNDIEPWKEWENGLRQLYKEMLIDAFKELKIKRPEKMELYFAGSLAKAQPTRYSDLDAFAIVANENDVQLVKPVFDAINHLCQRIFIETSQLYPDPIGINPGRLFGTPEQLYNQLKDGDVTNLDATLVAILTSKPILGSYVLGEELRNKIKSDPKFKSSCSAEAYYNKAISEFVAPKQNAPTINLKSHITRPLDFILMGLREEFNLYKEDGSHLSALGAIDLLSEKNKLPEEEILLLKSVYAKAMQKRFQLHNEHKKEHDEMPHAEAKEMLEDVAKLREMASRRLTNLNQASSKPQQPEETKGFFSRNASTLKTIGVVALVLVVGAAVGVGLGLGGVLALPFAAAAAGAVVAVVAIGYGIYKAAQGISHWIDSKNLTTKENVSSHSEVTESYKGPMRNLGPSIEVSQNQRPNSSAQLDDSTPPTVKKTVEDQTKHPINDSIVLQTEEVPEESNLAAAAI